MIPGASNDTFYNLRYGDETVGNLYIIGCNSPASNQYHFFKVLSLETDGFNGNNLIHGFENCNEPNTATLFYNYNEPKSIIDKLVNYNESLTDSRIANFKPDVLQIKNVCEQYYCITHYPLSNDVKITKEWLYRPINTVQNNYLNSTLITVYNYYFKEYVDFVNKYNELKSNCINGLQSKIIELHQRKPEELLT